MNKVGKVLTGIGLFVGGYLVGFYELKYRMYKAVTKSVVDKLKKDKEDESQR